jgi:hypothetical protein
MAVLGEIVEILKRWDVWRRVEAAPDRIDELEKRVADLETRLQRAPGEACPSCGALDYRVERAERDTQFGEMGGRRHFLKCGSCGFTDQRLVLPKG